MSESYELFGDSGNFADYWLGTPGYDNTRLLGQTGWYSAELLLRAQRYREIRNYRGGDEGDDAMESIMSSDFERGGGLKGGTPQLAKVRAGLIQLGHRSLAWKTKLKG